jgi:hypothetical protein
MTMNHTPDTTAVVGNGGSLDPQQAAALLDQTTQQTRRRIEPYPPWLLAIRAVMALVIYGSVWLTVRGQHPYNHPTAAVIPVLVVLVIVNFVATVTVARRATAGLAGRSRLRPAETAAMVVVWIGVFVVLGFLPGAGVSRAVTYGIYPAAVPMLAAGLAWAGIMAARANWRACGSAIAVAVIGVLAVFAGPVGAWAVVGVGLFAELLGAAAFIAWRQRRSVV